MTTAWQINARQFLLGPQPVSARNLTSRITIKRTPSEQSPAANSDWTLSHHPKLEVERHSSERTEIVCLGIVLDPAHPSNDNSLVLRSLTERCKDFASFERAAADLGGRWLMLIRIGSETRLYPDATGARSAFVLRDASGMWIASQPGLFAEALGTKRDDSLQSRFDAHKHDAASWPGELTPFMGVKQLMPNHYVDLNRGTMHRFWPTEPITTATMQDAAVTVADLLHGTMAAALKRGTAAMPLTAGYDSRSLFACAKELRPSIPFFRILGHHLPSYDTTIPRKLVRRFKLSIRELEPQHCDKATWEIMQGNVARMWWDPADYMINTFALMNVRFVLIGQLSEIARCFYYPDGNYPETITPQLLAKVAHYNTHPLAIDAFAEWFDGVPRDVGPHALDLFYWEHRAGNWAAMMSTACDMFIEPLAPYNCRRLLETAVGIDVAYRRNPYALHREICRITAPEVLKYPFNFSWRDTISDAVASVIPWRVRMAITRWRHADVQHPH